MINITQSGEPSKNNGHKEEYQPSVEFERVDVNNPDLDVWYEVNPETRERIDVTYTKDILDRIEQTEDEDDESSSSE